MSLRPTDKFIYQSVDVAARDKDTRTANEKVQILLKANQSCGTCTKFTKVSRPRCINPKAGGPKIINHYNICSHHSYLI